MLQNLGVHFLCTQSFSLLRMDIDSDVEDFLDPIGKMFKEIPVPDPEL